MRIITTPIILLMLSGCAIGPATKEVSRATNEVQLKQLDLKIATVNAMQSIREAEIDADRFVQIAKNNKADPIRNGLIPQQLGTTQDNKIDPEKCLPEKDGVFPLEWGECLEGLINSHVESPNIYISISGGVNSLGNNSGNMGENIANSPPAVSSTDKAFADVLKSGLTPMAKAPAAHDWTSAIVDIVKIGAGAYLGNGVINGLSKEKYGGNYSQYTGNDMSNRSNQGNGNITPASE